jgi:hypothetical protein
MKHPAVPGVSAQDFGSRATAFVVIAVLGAVTVAVTLLWDGDPLVAIGPCIVAAIFWAIWSLPLRVSMVGLLLAAWMLEVPGDAFAAGQVRTPWHFLGALLFAKLNLTVPVSWLVFSGFDLLIVFFAVAIVHRHVTRSGIDGASRVPAPAAIRQVALLSLFAVVWIAALGMIRGGSFRFALWQISKHFYLPIIYLLMAEAMRGVADLVTLGRVLLGAGIFRAAEAMIIRRMFPSADALPHATTHHDSVLFAVCVCILLAILLERPTRRTLKIAAVLAPAYLGGMFANHRRLVWVEVGATIAFFLLISRMGKTKRFVLRASVAALIPGLLYVAAGWNSGGGRLFGPVRTIRSVFDAKINASTRWREWENYDLVATFIDSPLTGSGFGHPYKEVVALPDVTKVYPLEPYVPHNSVLGLWAFGGLVGFALLWMIYPVGVFFTVRAYRWARTPVERIAALAAAATQICYLMQAYGDLGFGTWGPVFSLAMAYAIVGKICVANGAWPMGPAAAADQRS